MWLTGRYWSKILTKCQKCIALAMVAVWFVSVSAVIIGAIKVQARLSTISAPRPEFGTYPPDCGHLYNVDKHKEWAACMGVGYVPLTTKLQMKRNDI